MSRPEKLPKPTGGDKIFYAMSHKIPYLNFVKLKGAFYIMVTLSIKDTEDFARYLLLKDFKESKEAVMIAPGSGFYIDSARGRSEARLTHVLEEHKLSRGAQPLGFALDAYIP